MNCIPIVMILMGVMSALANPYESDLVIQLLMGILLVSLGALQFWTALGLRALKSWIRVPVAILSGIGLLGFPLGTLVNGYILYLVFSRRGKTILSEEYKHVIAATPHIKYKTSIIVWILLGILLTLLAIAILVAVVPATLGPR